MSDLWNEIQPYRCVDGLVHNRWCDPGERNPSDNGVAYTSATGIALFLRGELTAEIKAEIDQVLGRCEDPFRPGLFNRAPYNFKQEGPDDYLWLAAYAAITGDPRFAGRVLDHGLQHPFEVGKLSLYFNFCNVCREDVLHRSSWMGRQGQWVAHVRIASRRPTEWPAWWQRAWWGLNLLFSSRAGQGDQDAWMHSWALTFSTNGLELGWWMRWTRARWLKAFSATFPNGLSDVLAGWLTDPFLRPHLSGPNHPLARYWPKSPALTP